MKKLLHAAALALAMLAAVTPASARAQQAIGYQAQVNNVTKVVPVTAANPLPVTAAGGGTTVKATAVAPTYVEGSTSNQLSTDLSGGLRVSGSISATSAMKSTAADPSYTEGVTTNPISSDLAGYQRVLVKGSLTNISGTVSLPTGAATSALQTTLNGLLPASIGSKARASSLGVGFSTEDQALVSAISTALTNVTGTKAPGTAAANSLLIGCMYTSGGITMATTNQAAVTCDSTGAIRVSGAGGGTQFPEDAAHTTGDLGTMALAVRSDTAASTAGTTGDYQPLITDSTGRLWSHTIAAASDYADGWDATMGTKADAAWTSGSGSGIALLKAIAAAAIDTTTPTPMKIDQTTPGTTNHVDAGLSATATGGCTPYGLASAATTNSTSVKASAGTLCSVSAVNTTATLYYLRLYNAASAPTCSSATGFVMTIPVPASTTGAGVVVNTGSFGWAFSTGIGFCLTAGGSSTDNTSAATGVYLAASYK